MSACACPIILGDCIGVDSPITGLSSLADDHCFFYASCSPRADAFAPAPLGGGIATQTCAYTTLAAETQAEANALAAAACNGLPSPEPPPPPPPPIPGNDLFICNATNFSEVVSPNIDGLQPPLSFSLLFFPTGINITSDAPYDPNKGLVYGLTTTPGDFPIASITVFDVTGKFLKTQYAVTVLGLANAPTLADANSHTGYSVQLPTADATKVYAIQLVTAGGFAPINFSLPPAQTPAVPTWLSLSPSGQITGTPQVGDAGLNEYFDVTMTDAKGHVCTQTVFIPIGCVLGADTLPKGMESMPYNETLGSTFGTGPRTFATTDLLPPGLALHADGVIDGTPEANSAATTHFTVTVTDALGHTCDDACTLIVLPCAPLTILGNGIYQNTSDATVFVSALSGGFPWITTPFQLGPNAILDYAAYCVATLGYFPSGIFDFDIGCNAVATATWPGCAPLHVVGNGVYINNCTVNVEIIIYLNGSVIEPNWQVGVGVTFDLVAYWAANWGSPIAGRHFTVDLGCGLGVIVAANY